MNAWFQAFVLTQIVEVPIYLAFARSVALRRRVAFAFGASLVTHPFVWFIALSGVAPFPVLVAVAEAFAFVAEAMIGRRLSVPRPWLASLVANSSSIAVGMLTRELFDWP